MPSCANKNDDWRQNNHSKILQEAKKKFKLQKVPNGLKKLTDELIIFLQRGHSVASTDKAISSHFNPCLAKCVQAQFGAKFCTDH